MNIIASYDSSVTSLNPTLKSEFEGAVQAACAFYDKTIAENVTVDITFGYGEVDGQAISGAVGENIALFYSYSYDELLSAAKAADVTSPIQQAAAAILPASDPTNGAGEFDVNTAQARALGLDDSYTGDDGFVGINSSDPYSWTQSNVAAGTYDAVGVLEHEISEVLGRSDNLGADDVYTLLDFYHYTAADGLAGQAPGAAAGSLDEPFVSGYNSRKQAYFSYNGKTITLPYSSPREVAQGDDVGDWDLTTGDSYGFAVAGTQDVVSTTDLEEMNVLGYTLADTITQSAPASLTGKMNSPISLSALTVSETSPIGGNILATTLTASFGVFNVGSSSGAMNVSGTGTSTLTITGVVSAINAVLATVSYQDNGGYNGNSSDTIYATTTGGGTNTSGVATIAVYQEPTVTAAQYSDYGASLDASPAGFAISDLAANVSSDFAALAADPHLLAITLTDSGTPVLALTAAEVLNSTPTLRKITNASYQIDIVDTSADLEALTATQIATLASLGAVALISSNGTVVYGASAGDEIRSLSLTVGAPSGFGTRENFSDGSALVYYYGPAQSITQKVAINADGSFTRYVYNAPSTFLGTPYTTYDVIWTSASFRSRLNFFDGGSTPVAYQQFTGGGNFVAYVGATLMKQNTVNADGSYDLRSYDVPGVVDGLNYYGVDVFYNAAGFRDEKTFFDINNNNVATQTFAPNGGFTIYAGSTLLQSKTVNADGTFEDGYYQLTGSTYSSLETDYNASSILLATTYDNSDGSGSIDIAGSNLTVDANAHRISPTGGAADFTFNAHSPEIYAFASGAAADTVHFASGFGAAQVSGLSTAAASDILDLSALFGGYTALTSTPGAMVSSNGNTVITDGAGDTLTLLGVSPSSLTGARFNLS